MLVCKRCKKEFEQLVLAAEEMRSKYLYSGEPQYVCEACNKIITKAGWYAFGISMASLVIGGIIFATYVSSFSQQVFELFLLAMMFGIVVIPVIVYFAMSR